MQNTPAPSNDSHHYNFHDVEIDLFELVEGLWRQKWLIVGITAGCAVLAVVALLLMSPTYESQGFIRAPLSSSLTPLASAQQQLHDMQQTSDQATTEEHIASPPAALNRVGQELKSLNLRRQVFDANLNALFEELPESEQELNTLFLEVFSPAIAVVAPKLDAKTVDEEQLSITYNYTHPDIAAAVVNALIESAHESATADVLQELQTSISASLDNLRSRLTREMDNQSLQDRDEIAQLREKDQLEKLQLEDQIAALRQTAAKQRADQIARLEESLSVAKSLGIDEATSLAVLSQRQSTPGDSVAVTTDLSAGEDPDYLKGTRILKAELAALRSRKSEDPDIPRLRELEEKLGLLGNNRQVEILEARKDYTAFTGSAGALRSQISQLEALLARDYSNVALMRVDQVATPPSEPIKPRKTLILAVAVVLGGMLGVLVALVRNAVLSRRSSLAEAVSSTG
ncbi:MAG: chain length determinant protein (polysaccharide antigen chain regulator) [Halioglobus sp.]|jgi:chain length determinant protein (polysaccharide antigen chain regulator)